MSEGVLSFETIQVGPEDVEKSREALINMGIMLSSPGGIYTAIRKSTHADQVNAATRALLHLLVDIDTGSDADIKDDNLEKLSRLQADVQAVYWDFLKSEASKVSTAIQILDPKELFEAMDPIDNLSDLEEYSEEAVSRLNSLKSLSEQSGFIAMKPHEPLARIMGASIAIAGGHDAYTKMQASVVEQMPKDSVISPAATISTQIIGTLMVALSERGHQQNIIGAQVFGTIELMRSASRCTSMTTIPDWLHTGPEIAISLANMAGEAIRWRFDEHSEGAEAQSVKEPAPEFKETSTAFTGNGTVN